MQTFVSMDHAEQGERRSVPHGLRVSGSVRHSSSPADAQDWCPGNAHPGHESGNGFCKQCPMYRKTHALPRVEQAAFRLPTDAYWGLLGPTRAS
jgi:hypothetical protein